MPKFLRVILLVSLNSMPCMKKQTWRCSWLWFDSNSSATWQITKKFHNTISSHDLQGCVFYWYFTPTDSTFDINNQSLMVNCQILFLFCLHYCTECGVFGLFYSTNCNLQRVFRKLKLHENMYKCQNTHFMNRTLRHALIISPMMCSPYDLQIFTNNSQCIITLF